jgi:hypothetical protein
LEEGVRRVCAVQARMVAKERAAAAAHVGTNGDRHAPVIDPAAVLQPPLPPLTLPSAAM